VISDDLTHDESPVDAFHRAMYLELKKQGIRQDAWTWWSDGGPAHSKLAAAFVNLTAYSSEFDGLIVDSSFGASAHMKGEWDGAARHVKRSVDMYLMKQEALILTAREYYEYCHKNLSERAASSSSYDSRRNKVTLARRRFLFVPASDVKREPGRPTFKVDKVHPVHQIHYAAAAAAAATTPPPLEVGTY